MIITFQDELGLVSVKVDKTHGVTFGFSNVFFTDEDGKDYKVKVDYVISISAE